MSDKLNFEIPGLTLTSPEVATKELKILVYGGSGVGKTKFAGTAEDAEPTAPVLYCDIEGGVLTLASDNRGRALRVQRVTSINPVMVNIHKYLKNPQRVFKSVVIDSLTDLQALSMAEIRGGTTTNTIPTMQEWGRNTDQVNTLIRQFRDLSVHFIATCLSQEVKDEMTGTVMQRPLLPGKLVRGVMRYFDIVGYLQVERVPGPDKKPVLVRRMYFQPTENWDAKDRSNKLGLYMDNPTIPKLLDLIHGTAEPARPKLVKQPADEAITKTVGA